MKLLRIFAKSAAFIFHPLLMPTYAAILILNTNFYLSIINIEIKYYIYLLILFLSFCVPAIAIVLFYLFGITESIKMEKKEERIIPLALISINFLICWIILRYNYFPAIFTKLFFASCVLSTITLFITKYFKISLYCIGIGGMIGYLFSATLGNIDVSNFILLSIFIAGILGSSRLLLKKHNAPQVYIGYITGFITIFTLS